MTYFDAHTHHPSPKKDTFFILCEPLKEPELVPHCLGLHPWQIKKEIWSQQLDEAKAKISLNRPLAVGEIGLDKVIELNLEIQTQIFVELASLAKKLNLPCVIHCVRAHNELLNLHRKIGGLWLIHDFRSSFEIASQWIETGNYLSFSKALIEGRGQKKLQDIFLNLPKDRVFMETDDQKEPDIQTLIQFSARLSAINLQDWQAILWQNALNFFGPDLKTGIYA